MNVKKKLLVSVSASPVFPYLSRQVVALDRRLTRGGRYDRSLDRFGGMKSVTLFVPGRKTGRITEIQVLGVRVGDAWHVAGSNFGRGGHPLWTLNLLSAERIEAVIRGRRTAVDVEFLTGAERAAVWDRLVAEWPNFAVYQERSGRELRVFRLRTVEAAPVVADRSPESELLAA